MLLKYNQFVNNIIHIINTLSVCVIFTYNTFTCITIYHINHILLSNYVDYDVFHKRVCSYYKVGSFVPIFIRT